MNKKENENFSSIKRKKLFIQSEDCKNNNDKVFNNLNNNKNNYENFKTYNNCNLKLNIKSNSFNINKNLGIDNEYFITEKNDDKNHFNERNKNNKNEKLTNDVNNSNIKQSFENNNKNEKEDNITPNISTIEDKNSEIKDTSLKKQNILENNDNKENININNDNIKRKTLIQEPNFLKSTKLQVLKRKINNRNNKNNEDDENSKNNEIKQQNMLFHRTFKNENNLNNNCNNNIKNKLYHYLTNLEVGNSNDDSKYNYNNMRLSILKRKARIKTKFESLDDNVKSSRMTYVGLKRYQNISLSNISQIQKGLDTFYMINENKNKVNQIKREISDIDSNKIQDVNKNQKIYDILKKNKGIEDIFTTMVKPDININNKNKKHYNKILTQLNKTIEKLPKNEGNFEIEKIDFNRTFRKFSDIKTYEISPIDKIRKTKLAIFDKVNLTKVNNYYDKNKKLIFESKVNEMNNTINKLLKETYEYNTQKIITFPANNFRKMNSISKIYNNRKNTNKIILI